MFGNDFSNATALFELNDGGAMRTNEMRRVGYPSHIRESRFRFFGTEASFEQLAKVTVWQDKANVHDISEQMESRPSMSLDDPSLANVAPELRDAFVSGLAPVHDSERLPEEFRGAPNGHEGSHHFLVDDFVTAVNNGTLPPVNAWTAARFTLPGIVAHESALRGGERLPIRDFGDAPASLLASMDTMTTPAVPAPRTQVTRKDVARYAGVSTAVVSYVVNGGPKKVAPATEAKVQDAIRLLGYRPNAAARALKLGSTETIGLIIPDNSNPFFSMLAHAVEDAAAELGYALFLTNSDGNLAKERRNIRNLAARQVDGVVLASVLLDPDLTDLEAAEIPSVLLSHSERSAGFTTVGVDLAEGARTGGGAPDRARPHQHRPGHGHHHRQRRGRP